MKRLIFAFALVFVLSGCATRELAVKKGMNKDDVMTNWGQPRVVKTNMNSCCLQPKQEEWFYFNTPMMKNKRPKKYIYFEDEKVKYVFAWHRRHKDMRFPPATE